MNNKNNFAQGSISANILSLAIPMTLAQLINVLYNVIDRMYIVHIPNASTLALTGIGLTFPIITMILAFANLFGMGGAPLCSIARGKGDYEKAEKIMGNSFFMLIISGVVLTILFLVFKEPLLYLFGASKNTFPYANSYLTIYLLGSIFVCISLGMNSFINSQGFGRIGMMTVLLGAITNLLLDPLFIFVFNMGVTGAALATVISQLLSTIWVLKFLTSKKAILKLKVSNIKLDISLVKEITSLGMSGFIMSITNGAVQIVCNSTLQTFGGDLYVGIMTVISSIREVITMPVSGLVNGAQPILGFNYGAKKYSRVKKGIKFMYITCIIYTTLIWLTIMLIPKFLINIFNNDPELIAKGIPSLNIYFFGFFMMALQFAGQATFVALKRPKQSIFFSLLRKAIIVIPVTLILPNLFNLGVYGVFLAEPISNFICGIASFTTMMLTVWKSLKKEKPTNNIVD